MVVVRLCCSCGMVVLQLWYCCVMVVLQLWYCWVKFMLQLWYGCVMVGQPYYSDYKCFGRIIDGLPPMFSPLFIISVVVTIHQSLLGLKPLEEYHTMVFLWLTVTFRMQMVN